MKNILFKILPFVAAVLLAMSCGKDDGDDVSIAAPDNTAPSNNVAKPNVAESEQAAVENNDVPSIPFSIEVRMDDESLSKAWIKSDDDLTQIFQKYDEIKVTGPDIYGTLTGSNNISVNGSTSAYFSGTLYGQGVLTITDDTQLNLSIGSKLKQPGEKYYLGLKDAFLNYGYLTATCTYGNSSAKFTQQTAFLDINLEYSAKINVEIDGTDYPIFLVPTGFPVHYLIAVPNGATVSSSFFKTRTIDVSDGKVVKRITRSLPTRCAPCAFSVSATKQVFFCTSNIGCEKQSSDYYRFFFHTHPWDIEWPTDEFDVGEDHSSVSQWDLFGWGTWVNGYTSAPSLTSMNVSDYKWVGSDPHKEAAVNPDAGWYTLTSDEWEYLIKERAMYNDGPRYMRATIKDGEKEVPGLILFADSHQYWEPNDIQTWACSGDKVTSIDASFDGNVILASNWENWQKKQGAIFLPAAGCRIGTTIDKKYSDGYYWSSSKINSNFAWAMSFSKDGVQVNYVSGIAHHPAGPEDGFSVRLVQDIR